MQKVKDFNFITMKYYKGERIAMIYLDNAATTLKKPETVGEAMKEAVNSHLYGNPGRGTYDFALNSARVILKTREIIRDFFQADASYEVVFNNSATMGLNTLLKGLLSAGDHVLATSWDHNAILRPLYQLEKQGIDFSLIQSEPITGKLYYDELEQKLRPETKLFVCSHASNVTGNVLDLEKIQRFCKQHQLFLIVDVAQTAGQCQLDLSNHAIDAICFTGHKSLYGPTGIGGICLKKNLVIEPLLSGGDGIRSFDKEQFPQLPSLLEAGTLNIPGIMGLAKGFEYINQKGLETIQTHMEKLTSLVYDRLYDHPDFTFYGDFTQARVGTLSFNYKNVDSAQISDYLWENAEIATRSGYHCAPKMHEALGTVDQGTVRLSFSTYTTEEEIETLLSILTSLNE